MIEQQQKLVFSSFSELYELIIPKDNILRRIHELIDFSFIYDELSSKYCHDNGRTAESPIRLFKYLLLKVIYNISDVDVVERSRVDMSFKYFLEIAPEADVINPSTLTKFRRLRLKDTDLLNLLIGKTVSIAIEKGIIKSKSIIVDATHTKSRSNPLSPTEVLKERAKLLRKMAYSVDENIKNQLPQKNTEDDLEQELNYCSELINFISKNEIISNYPKVKEKLNLLQETIEDTQDKYTLSKDQDARTGHKSADSSFFGYKSHIGMTEERIITAAVVTSGDKGDGPQLKKIVEQSIQNGMEVDTVIGDSAYSGKGNLIYGNENNIQIVSKLNPAITQGFRKEEDKFEYNKDAAMFVCPAGHMAVRKAKQGAKNIGTNQTLTYYFDVEKCKICKLKHGCYKNGAKTKSYSVSINSKEHQEQIEFQNSDHFKDKSKHRYKIEAKNGELKNVHGFDRAISYGLENMQMQTALTIFAVNLKRILKLS